MLLTKVQRWIDEPMGAILFLVLGSYAAYVPAEAPHASGVLATVSTGLYGGRKLVPRLPASIRLTSSVVLQMVSFLINGLLFILLGMRWSTVTAGIDAAEQGRAIALGELRARGEVPEDVLREVERELDLDELRA